MEQLRNRKQYADLDSFPDESQKQKDTGDHQLEEAIAKLPDSYREMILRRFYSGQSCLQIAEDLNMPTGTVTKQLSRAYAKLRQILSGKNEVRK